MYVKHTSVTIHSWNLQIVHVHSLKPGPHMKSRRAHPTNSRRVSESTVCTVCIIVVYCLTTLAPVFCPGRSKLRNNKHNYNGPLKPQQHKCMLCADGLCNEWVRFALAEHGGWRRHHNLNNNKLLPMWIKAVSEGNFTLAYYGHRLLRQLLQTLNTNNSKPRV